MINNRYVLIVDDTTEVIDLTLKLFKKENGFVFVHCSSDTPTLRSGLQSIPDLIVVNADNLQNDVRGVCEFVRKNKENNITPIIITTSTRDEEFKIDMMKNKVEYVISKPLNEKYFYYTIRNISGLISANRCISALTGLPGNIQIENELKRRISSRSQYAVMYIDLDNFKAYNDKYGFMNGDEVIKFTSDVIQEAVQKYGVKGDFVGHVGGDDFVTVVNYENAKKIARYIIKKFDTEIVQFYTEDDVSKGYIKVLNRKGKLEKYAIMTITVAMLSNKFKKYVTPLEIGEDGASIKKKAKTIEGSTFLEDKRKK
ncbi:MAG: diguanylate cyclase [Clostridia bacterium]|nr:diguanylate cyclase [Clostridia bacterium]